MEVLPVSLPKKKKKEICVIVPNICLFLLLLDSNPVIKVMKAFTGFVNMRKNLSIAPVCFLLVIRKRKSSSRILLENI